MRILASIAAAVAAALITAPQMAAAAYDPPGRHYSASRLRLDPDLKTAMPASHFRGFLRVSIDLSKRMPPVGDQGGLASGFAWAVAYAARSYYAGTREGRDVTNPHNEASPNFVFMVASRGDCAGGATLSDTVGVLRQGALSLAAFPYTTDCRDPTRRLIAAATDFRVEGYRVLDRGEIDDIKGQLERGNPVIVPFLVSPAFEAFRGSGTFDEKDFSASGDDRWQALTVVGYDDHRQAARVMNSWGRGWGDGGYAWIAYEALTARISSAIVLRTAPARAAPMLVPAIAPTPVPEQVAKPPVPVPPALPSAADAVAPTKDSLPGQKRVPIRPDAAASAAPAKSARLAQPAATPVKISAAAASAPTAPARLSDLGGLVCGKIGERRENGHVILHGFVATPADLAKVKAIVDSEQAQGRDYRLGDVRLAPWPLCEALATLDKALVNPIRPRLATVPAEVAKAGDLLRITLRSPAQPSYIYLSYFQADRTVLTLAQPSSLALSETPPNSAIIFGDGEKGRAKFLVGPPFGTEMLVALASASPLFPSGMPQRQGEREYLSMLRKALIYKPFASLPDRDVGAAITILTTRAD